ncbi:MAG: hypothetical protein WA191_05145 [Telluria sp.]
MTTPYRSSNHNASTQPGNGRVVTPSFQITVRTGTHCTKFSALAESASDAWGKASELFGDTPCGISVTPGRPQ